jgi:hypothetical protein
LILKLKHPLCGNTSQTEEILTAVQHKVAQIGMSDDANGICDPLLCVGNKQYSTLATISKLINSLYKWFVLYYLLHIHTACHKKIIKP